MASFYNPFYQLDEEPKVLLDLFDRADKHMGTLFTQQSALAENLSSPGDDTRSGQRSIW